MFKKSPRFCQDGSEILIVIRIHNKLNMSVYTKFHGNTSSFVKFVTDAINRVPVDPLTVTYFHPLLNSSEILT